MHCRDRAPDWQAPDGVYSWLGSSLCRWSLFAQEYFHAFHNSSASSIEPQVSVGLPTFALMFYSLIALSIPIVTVETGVHRGKPLQRILGYQAYTNPAAKLSQIVLSVCYTNQGSWYSPRSVNQVLFGILPENMILSNCWSMQSVGYCSHFNFFLTLDMNKADQVCYHGD